MRRALLLALPLLIAACGTPSHDLFAVERSGDIPDADLRMVVNDGGTVTCGRDEPAEITGDELLEAREIADDLALPADRRLRLRARPGSILSYTVHAEQGTVVFADNARGKPPVLDRLAFFVRRVAKSRCGRAR
jgi:hypothetical protein